MSFTIKDLKAFIEKAGLTDDSPLYIAVDGIESPATFWGDYELDSNNERRNGSLVFARKFHTAFTQEFGELNEE